MKKPAPHEPIDPTLDELSQIKRLLAFALIKSGTKQDQLAAVLGTSQSSVSKMFGKGAFEERERK